MVSTRDQEESLLEFHKAAGQAEAWVLMVCDLM
jgi:hypothetical protein